MSFTITSCTRPNINFNSELYKLSVGFVNINYPKTIFTYFQRTLSAGFVNINYPKTIFTYFQRTLSAGFVNINYSKTIFTYFQRTLSAGFINVKLQKISARISSGHCPLKKLKNLLTNYIKCAIILIAINLLQILQRGRQ